MSPNSMSIMAVVAHYLDRDFVNRSRLIALRRLQGPHSDETMVALLVNIIQEFEISDESGASREMSAAMTHCGTITRILLVIYCCGRA
jgi:hypothetical protein